MLKKLKGFTLVELVVVMAIVITMAGATLTSNSYNEKETINNVAVKCQTLIAAARNEALVQIAPRWVTLNYSQDQVTYGKFDSSGAPEPPDGTYALPSPVIFASGGSDLRLSFDAFGELETYNSGGGEPSPLTKDSAGVHTDPPGSLAPPDPTGSFYLPFFLTNKAGTLVEEVRINPNGSSTLVWGAPTTAGVDTLTAVIYGPTAAEAGQACSYFSAVEGGKPPYTYLWSGGGTPATWTMAAFPTQWADLSSEKELSLIVTDSSPKQQTATVKLKVFPLTGTGTFTAFIIPPNDSTPWDLEVPATWDQGVDATFTAEPIGGVPPYRYAWTCADGDATVSAGMGPSFTTQWSGLEPKTTKTIKLIVTDSSEQQPAPATCQITVCPFPTVTISSGPTSGKLNIPYSYICTPADDNRVYTYAWTGGGSPATGTASVFTTNWATTGLKPVSLTITDRAKQSASATLGVTIYSAPTVTLTGGIVNGKLATPYTYTPTVIGGQGPYTYAWSGGGTPATGTASSFTTQWASAGPKMLTLTITDALGQTATITPYNVTLYSAPTVVVTGPANGKLNTPYYFTATASGGMAPYTFDWGGSTNPSTSPAQTWTINTWGVGAWAGHHMGGGCGVTVTDSLGQKYGYPSPGGSAGITIYDAPTVSISENQQKEVTAQVAGLVSGGTLSVGATNINFGDPAVGIAKQLKVIYTYNGVQSQKTVAENATLILPDVAQSPFNLKILSALYGVLNPIGTVNVGYTFTDTVVGGMAPYRYEWSYNSTSDNPHTSSWSSPGTYNQWTTVIDALDQRSNNPYVTITVVNPLTLTYTAGAGGTISGTTPQTVNYGANGTAVTAVPATNYIFVNWSDTNTINPRTDTNVTGNIAVTANFVFNKFLVTFKNWDETTLGTPSYVTSGGTATAPSNPTYTGYTFTGWNRVLTNITATTTIMATRSIDHYTVTFVDWNGTAIGTPQSIAYGGNAAAPTSPTGTGYPFVHIGDNYGGGKVAYISSSGFAGWSGTYTGVTSAKTITATYTQHGLIAATADQSRGKIWATISCYYTTVPGDASSKEIGTGLANTNKIIAQNGAGTTYAAGLARAYTGGGYSDWYLPSFNELRQLWINQVAIGGFYTGGTNGAPGEAVSNGYWTGAAYWSSSDYGPGGGGNAWAVFFGADPGAYGAWGCPGKTATNMVRAVRSF